MAQKPKKRRRSRNDPQRKQAQHQREEARRRLAEERRAQAEAEAQKAKRMALVRRLGLPAFAGIAVFAVALVLFRPARELPGVQRPVEIEAQELAAGATYDYGSDTPTSGPYLPGDPTCGMYATQVTPEDAVTALYHGGVVLWYSPELGAEEVIELAALAGEYPAEVLLSRNAAIDEPIIATAWGRLRGYDGPGDDVKEF
ncbi:MAG TPA: DUF3105 domain-containing protein, partial [Acidimicrobiia bacterium]|nr:DUF3105 domain-containing protein [Acidimicrobiia bacterium]